VCSSCRRARCFFYLICAKVVGYKVLQDLHQYQATRTVGEIPRSEAPLAMLHTPLQTHRGLASSSTRQQRVGGLCTPRRCRPLQWPLRAAVAVAAGTATQRQNKPPTRRKRPPQAAATRCRRSPSAATSPSPTRKRRCVGVPSVPRSAAQRGVSSASPPTPLLPSTPPPPPPYPPRPPPPVAGLLQSWRQVRPREEAGPLQARVHLEHELAGAAEAARGPGAAAARVPRQEEERRRRRGTGVGCALLWGVRARLGGLGGGRRRALSARRNKEWRAAGSIRRVIW